jgi:hypothetical protein
MKSPSLDRFYFQINKAILLAASFTEIEELSFIIRSCRLKPYNIFYNNDKYSLQLYKHWFDEFGNSLNIVKNKRLNITYNDLKLCRKNLIQTDLYAGLSLNKFIKISKLCYLIIGKVEDTSEYCIVLTLLGLDNYLRSYMLYDNAWEKVSPLTIGLKRLRRIAKNLDIKYFLQFKNKENCVLPCAETNEWITCMGPSKDLVDTLNKLYDIDFSFLT